MTPDRIETVIECSDLDAMTAFFVDELAMRVDTISPADDPQEIGLSGSGMNTRLRRAEHDRAVHLVAFVNSDQPAGIGSVLTAPNGTTVEVRSASTAVTVPPSVPTWSLVRAGDRFGAGRAGMGYRDLLPDRWGGRFIASHILIADGGDVADSVHFHRIRFQMIFCARGWVDLVYEDQGEPFRLDAGDCVLQPPGIRHRVLRSSPGLEVIEIGCPAVHDTVIEHDIALPTPIHDANRRFDGQRFVRHVASRTPRGAHPVGGFMMRGTGIADATDGLADAVVVEAVAPYTGDPTRLTHRGEFVFDVVLHGSVSVVHDDDDAVVLGARDAVAHPPGSTWCWSDWSDDFEMLEVTLPQAAVRVA